MKTLMKPIKRFINFLYIRLQATGVAYYISTTGSLPEPMTKDEEEALYAIYDEQKDYVKEQLIVRNLRLVVYISKKFESSGVPVDDLTSIGSIGLIKAANTFNPEKKIKIATYASRCIENEILMYLRKISNTKSELSIDEPLNVDYDGNELHLGDLLFSEQDNIGTDLEKQADKDMLSMAIAKLSPREREIMEMRYGLVTGIEKTQKEVADEIGISQSYISRLEKKIIKRLKREIEKVS